MNNTFYSWHTRLTCKEGVNEKDYKQNLNIFLSSLLTLLTSYIKHLQHDSETDCSAI